MIRFGTKINLAVTGGIKSMRSIIRQLFKALPIPVLACSGLYAQSVSQIAGTVRDASGLAVPGAEVTATQTDTSLVRTAVTSADGTYVLPSLPIGPYRLEIRNAGFSTLVGPGYFDVDVALSRKFIVRESQNFEIRAEAFNLQNRTNFLNPTSALNSSNFGRILTDVSPRIMQFAVKYAF
jgi:hypothetical protein